MGGHVAIRLTEILIWVLAIQFQICNCYRRSGRVGPRPRSLPTEILAPKGGLAFVAIGNIRALELHDVHVAWLQFLNVELLVGPPINFSCEVVHRPVHTLKWIVFVIGKDEFWRLASRKLDYGWWVRALFWILSLVSVLWQLVHSREPHIDLITQFLFIYMITDVGWSPKTWIHVWLFLEWSFLTGWFGLNLFLHHGAKTPGKNDILVPVVYFQDEVGVDPLVWNLETVGHGSLEDLFHFIFLVQALQNLGYYQFFVLIILLFLRLDLLGYNGLSKGAPEPIHIILGRS